MPSAELWKLAQAFLREVERRPHWEGTLDEKLRGFAPTATLTDQEKVEMRRCVRTLQEQTADTQVTAAQQDDLFGTTPYPDNQPGTVRGSPETSHEAAAQVARTLSERQHAVLGLYVSLFRGQGTAKDAERAADAQGLQRGRSTIAARTTELEGMGYLIPTGKKRERCRILEVSRSGMAAWKGRA
jgi:hypothetical protein